MNPFDPACVAAPESRFVADPVRRWALTVALLSSVLCVLPRTGFSQGLAPPADAYRLGPEDVLDIGVWKEPDLSRKDVLVRPDGGLSFPLVGEVQVAGRSVADVRHEIAERLRRYLPEPVVSVSVVKMLHARVYVIGKVNKPGEFMMGRPLDVLQALAMAGGLTPFAAADDIRIVRRDTAGTERTVPFRYSRVEQGQDLEQNIRLQAGDVVIVP